jgi:hypothetical protein
MDTLLLQSLTLDALIHPYIMGKLSLGLSKHHTVNVYSLSLLDGDECSYSGPDRFTLWKEPSGIHKIGKCVGPELL